MKKQTFFLLIFFSLTGISISSQNSFTKTIAESLDKFGAKFYPEKVYVHLDKDYYSNEETIWFSAYLINGITLLKSDKSVVTYVELMNPKDSIISRKKLLINDLNTAGDFQLNKKMPSGTYKVRAYTNYMQNQNASYFFEKEITIWSPEKEVLTNKISAETKESIITDNSFKPDLHFYPQGGYLVNNLPNRVAIKVKNIVFDELKFSGIIVDQNNNQIAKFSTLEFGLGDFFIIPVAGNSYFAIIKNETDTFKYKLPDALTNGFVLNALNTENEIFLELKSNTINGLLGATLIIHQYEKLIFSKTFSEPLNAKLLKFSKSKLKNGVVHFTLFNANENPVSERLIFINNDDKKANLAIKKQKNYFGNRKKVTLQINVTNEIDSIIPSKLSMSVSEVNSLANIESSENIKTWLLLNSDIKGKIVNPNYFFKKDQEIRKRSFLLDLLMLTNGWRRFTWQEIISSPYNQEKFKPEKGITISGKTLDMKSPYGVKSVPTRLTFIDKNVLRQEPVQYSNKVGQYSYGPFIFFDSKPVLTEARLFDFKSDIKNNREVLIIPEKNEKFATILKDTTKKILKKSKREINAYLNYQKYISEIDKAFQQNENVLDEIVINSKLEDKEEKREEEMNAQASYGNAFNRTDVSDDSFNNGTALQLFYRIPQVSIINDSLVINRQRNITPLILLDETPIDISELSSIPASEISFIDVLLNGEASIFSSNGAVISIFSKKRYGFVSSKNIKRKPGIIDYKVPGFYLAREFYAPDHINGLEEQTKADIRTTLHWEPTITINGKNEVEVSFFTSDIDGKYFIKVEGITNSGIPLYKTTEINVN